MALNVDIRKAYDRVSWTTLEHVMLQMGFAQIWVDFVMLCTHRVRYSIKSGTLLQLTIPLTMVPFVLIAVYAKEILFPYTYLFYALKVCLLCSHMPRQQAICMVVVLFGPVLVLLTNYSFIPL